MQVPTPVTDHLRRQFGLQVNRARSLSGGCIHQACCLETDQGLFFLKFNQASAYHNFSVEAQGLSLLAEANSLRIPAVKGTGQPDAFAFLLQEWIEPGPAGPAFWETLGRGLGQLHGHGADTFGLPYDNYIGALVQLNEPRTTWLDFFRDARLTPMIQLAQERGRLSTGMLRSFERLLVQLERWVLPATPSLIHGDLWGGNLLTDRQGNPVLIDPAVYYGHPEMELAFMTLFDRQPARFYQAYREVKPLADDWTERIDLYNLYPLLVHVNLFGGSYVQSVKSILDRFV